MLTECLLQISIEQFDSPSTFVDSDTIELTVDQVLPITQSFKDPTNDSTTDDGNQTDTVPPKKSPKQLISIHAAHDQVHAHFADPAEEPLQIEPTNTTKSGSRHELEFIHLSDNTSSNIPAPNLARSRAEAVEAFNISGVTPRGGTANEPMDTEQSYRGSRIVDDSDRPYAQPDSLTFFGNLNNTLLWTWTMIRSSIANLLVTGDGSVADNKRTPQLFKDAEKHQKNEMSRKE